MRLANGIIIDKEKTFGVLKFSALRREVHIQNEDGTVYISKASLRPFYDEHGNMYIVVDMELKGRIRAALIKAILGFEVRVK